MKKIIIAILVIIIIVSADILGFYKYKKESKKTKYYQKNKKFRK